MLALLVAGTFVLPCAMAQAADDGFVPLFDGKTLSGWTTLAKKPVTQGWVVEDGVLHRKDKGGDIYTEKDYGNFILEFEWKSAVNTNSGVKYRMMYYGKEYLGPEYQVFDDGEPAKPKIGNPTQRTAAIYELFAPNDQKKLNPPGEWNSGKIVANGTKLEHWINGQKVAEADTSSPEWAKAVAASKFNKYKPLFGANPSGRIMLQDHGTEVWYRNVRIKVLP
jgi:hypothetical protein